MHYQSNRWRTPRAARGLVIAWMVVLGSARTWVPAGDIKLNGDPQLFDVSGKPGRVVVEAVNGGLRFLENSRDILTYNRDPISQSDGRYNRGHYVHPLYDLDGVRMTDDMPKDHRHHRGVFWAWTQLWIGDKRIGHPWEQKDMAWDVTAMKVSNAPESATLFTTALWKSPLWLNDKGAEKAIVKETSTIRVHASAADARAIDFEISLLALASEVRLGGSMSTKGYGGFSVRIPLPSDLKIMGPTGTVEPDGKRPSPTQPWVDYSAVFGKDGKTTGLTILCHPGNPGFPHGWTIRRAASCQNPVYPGQKPVALSTEKPLLLRYRIVLHRDGFDAVRMKKFFEDYEGTVKWNNLKTPKL